MQSAVLDWYAGNARALAFRRTADPWSVLVSEVIAQQTQAARAAERWTRFMARFPTVTELATASAAEVQREWQGLGYNRRALALWRAARAIVSDRGGHVPSSVEELERLPGVGPYTARAVAAIAFARSVGAVDVNIRRVLGRLLAGAEPWITRTRTQAVADASVPPGKAANWTHALMDVGAAFCRPTLPRCDDCPARPWCRFASQRSSAQGLPAPRRARRPTTRFPATNRWLRGRIIELLRHAPDGQWVSLTAPIGEHDLDRVQSAARDLAAEGLIELATAPAGDERLEARLATG
jgi:A/G-specific adenine glycosylase